MNEKQYTSSGYNRDLTVSGLALASQFSTLDDLKDFYNAIPNEGLKKQFVKAAAMYYYIVKRGDWIVDAPEHCDPLIDYFTNSYKVVGLFAVIESLSDAPFQEFYKWIKSSSLVKYPIPNEAALDAMYVEYKKEHGSIRRCTEFFSRLSSTRQKELCVAMEVNGKPVGTIKKLADHLYWLRSKFVHEAQVVLQMSGPIHTFANDKHIFTKFDMLMICLAFEEGFVAYFREVST